MSLTLPIIEACEKLNNLPEELEKNPQTGEVIITRNGKPVLTILSWDRYESIMETLEVMGDEEMMTALRPGQETKTGHTYSVEEMKQEIGV